MIPRIVFQVGYCSSFLFLFASSAAIAQPTGQEMRPNILWITSEDNAAHWLGCYGNTDAKTPRLDALASKAVLFEHAYSNAPVCAVARSNILHGTYAVTTGTQNMRSRYAIPNSFRPYVSYLQDLGYYCTNSRKTDYNRAGKDTVIWNDCSQAAHYKNRQAGQAFFAVFNLTVTHESSLFPEKVESMRSRQLIPAQTRLLPSKVQLPGHLPNLPEVRQDIAIYHDNVTALDKRVGELLDELADSGLADETIVFYYADHGGPTPRGKRYLNDTGVRIPMIVHMPQKWQHLSPFAPGKRPDELVAFVDLAPTLLSLCGQKKPAQMQGRAFLGSNRVEPDADEMVFLFADRFDEIEGMQRGPTDGKYKYIRRFNSHLPAAPLSNYSLSMPSWAAWRKAWRDGIVAPAYRELWEAPQTVEELFDVETDPWEMNNLASDPQQRDRLFTFRKRLFQEMLAAYDTAVIPEAMFRSLSGDQTIYEYAHSDQFDLRRVLEQVFIATSADPKQLPAIDQMLLDDSPIVRYWGALGSAILGEAAVSTKPKLQALLNDAEAVVRMTAALALARCGEEEQAKATLIEEFGASMSPEAKLKLTNIIANLNYEANVPQDWIDRHLDLRGRSSDVEKYVQRFAKRLSERLDLD